jgi:5-methyltetrahydropteroyltriglutamate--homocysteine methyltransferase
MVQTALLGYPRIGAGRELKKALERYWSSPADEQALRDETARIRARHWKTINDAGITFIPSGDFSLYDHVLDTAAMVGAVPERYGAGNMAVSLPVYFAMARGRQEAGVDVPALEMTKWFDTNYHYIVPEIEPRAHFHLAFTQALDQFAEAKSLGIVARPVLLGPVTFLSLAKAADAGTHPLDLLDAMLPVYQDVLTRLASQGAEWVQMDEPILVTDMDARKKTAFTRAYGRLAKSSAARIMLTTYFGDLRDNLDFALKLPVAGLHLDLVRGPRQAEEILRRKPRDLVLSLGLVDGRNIWKANLAAAIRTAEQIVHTLSPDRVIVAPSCSLLHCPEDLAGETGLEPELAGWLSFARQKLDEIALIARALNEGTPSISAELEENARLRRSRAASPRVTLPAVRARVAGLTPTMSRRSTPHRDRRALQSTSITLPLFPTTTIGSFPQTQAVRAARADFKKGALSREEYERFLKQEIERTVRTQEEIGLDVLVHGEFERNDMVEYFGEMLSGFAFTKNGWVQSYGSRCVKPPIIYGDVARPEAMTVRWASYAQSLTARPLKGMLTGPVTILMWSFVRDDQPREATCRQIALAIRDEASDLEAAGIRIIQIDEPALREGLPLRAADRAGYLDWAVECFRLASSGVADATQVHTHMCYSEFNEILPSIAAMDADVLSIESARSRMELLGAFRTFRYPNEIGPGVYDIHSPRVPTEDEIRGLLSKALEVLPAEQLWVNPDCGLKTRQWKEVEPALRALVHAARRMRDAYKEKTAGPASRAAQA